MLRAGVWGFVASLALLVPATAHGSTLERTGGTVLYTGDVGADVVRVDSDGTDLVFSITAATRLAVAGGCAEDKANPGDVRCPLRGVTDVTVLGGDGSDQMSATPAVTLPLTLRGEAGDDLMSGGPGDDVLDGGDGDDTLDPLAGADTVRGGSGVDAITVRDAAVDTVSCGDGPDATVIADRDDDIAADCEAVDRPARAPGPDREPDPDPKPAPQPEPAPQAAPAPPQQPGPEPTAPAGSVEIGDIGQGDDRLLVTLRGRLAGTITIDVLDPAGLVLGSVTRFVNPSVRGHKVAVDLGGSQLRAAGAQGRVSVTVRALLASQGYAPASVERPLLIVLHPVTRFRRTGTLDAAVSGPTLCAGPLETTSCTGSPATTGSTGSPVTT